MLPELDQTPSLDTLRTNAQNGDLVAKQAYQKAYQEKLRMLTEQAHDPGLSHLEMIVLETRARNLTTLYS